MTHLICHSPTVSSKSDFHFDCSPLKPNPDAINGGDPGDGEEGAAGQGEEVGAVREAGEGPLPQGEGRQGGRAPGKGQGVAK